MPMSPKGRKRPAEATDRNKAAVLKASMERGKKEGNMTTQVERMKHSMFPSEGESVVNVKFFLGSGRRVTAEQLADQLDRADAQLRGKVTVRTTSLDGDLTVTTI